MGFAQLYYTSCENGLSDFAGFQFNAATPGVPQQVLREVEALTSYEPPRSLGYRPSPAEIAACPVNLVYRPEPTMMVANVVFVGLDFSQRLGNYFAHALVGQTEGDRFERILPIELWGSPGWADHPIAERELPALSALPDLIHHPSDPSNPADPPHPAELSPPTGALINRPGVDRFLATQDRPDELADLVTAAETAVLKQGRSIVIVEADSAAAAHWIAAISFLLPPAVARRMSFATYRHRPEYSASHVVATLPESDFDLDPATFYSYVVFDSASGRISDVAPEPAADLLVRAGAQGATRLWKRAATLVDDRTAEMIDVTGITLAECYPVLVTAALLEGLEVTAPDLDALADWLAWNPDALRPVDRGALLTQFLDHPELAAHHLHSLANLARSTPTQALENSKQVAQLRAAGEQVLGPALVQTGGAFIRADGTLIQNSDTSVQSHRASLQASSTPAHANGEDGLQALLGSPALLEGVLAHLEAVSAEDPDAIIEVFACGLGDLIDDEARLPLPLRRAALLARCQRDLLGYNGSHHPASPPAPENPAPPGRDWLIRAIADPSRDGGYLPTYLALCRAIEDGTVSGPLPGGIQDAVSSFLTIVHHLDQTRAESAEATALSLHGLAATYPQQRPPAQDLLCEELPLRIDELAGSRHLTEAVANWPEPLVAAYLETTRRRLAESPPETRTLQDTKPPTDADEAPTGIDGVPARIDAAAVLFETLQTLHSGADAVIAPALADVLQHSLRTWPPNDLDLLQERLKREDGRQQALHHNDSQLTTLFIEWRKQHLGGRLSRSLHRLKQRRTKAGTETATATEPEPASEPTTETEPPR